LREVAPARIECGAEDQLVRGLPRLQDSARLRRDPRLRLVALAAMEQRVAGEIRRAALRRLREAVEERERISAIDATAVRERDYPGSRSHGRCRDAGS